MIYFTADQHYGGDFIRIYYERPFATWQEMDKELIRRHNERVKPTDDVIIVGDYYHEHEKRHAWEHYKKQLNGRIWEIRGNHSPGDLVPIISATVNTPWGCAPPIGETDPELDIYEYRVFVTHDPEDADERYKINIVAHIHNQWRVLKKKDSNAYLINVCVDLWDFYPVSFEDVRIAIAEEKKGGTQ